MNGDVAEERRADQGSEGLPPLVPPPMDPRFSNSYPQQPQAPVQQPQAQPQPQSQMPVPPRPAQPFQPAQTPQPQPQQQPRQQGPQFPVARVFDGVGPNGSPTVNRQRLDPREVPALVGYLTQAPVALAAAGTTRDELVATAPAAVPRVFHTDGMWIWPAAVGYYLSQYQLPPQAELVAHIRSRNYTPVQVPQQVREAAARQILETLSGAPQQQTQPPQQTQQQPVQVQSPPQQQPSQPQPRYPPQYQPEAQPLPPQAPQPMPQQQQPPRPHQVPFETPMVARPTEFSEAFNTAGNRHAAWVGEQIETFMAFLPEGDWSVDHVSRRYLQSGRDFLVDGLGTLSPAGIWTWAWADPATWGQDTAITEQSRRLRAMGDRDGIPELVAPALDISDLADSPGDPQTAAEMISWTCTGLLTARGYIGHTATPDGGGRIYYVVCDASVPEARPTLGNVARFLMDGAATFAENATDCVLGYIEHHGWEWSRVPDGIVVAAEGVGSFTVEISADGRLTGLALHR
jgi:uncharacterized protein DUF6882